ncbi:MAG TPA: HAMP domain-containing sensor histidine kinase [Candidatus Limnocylindria bacterium]
MSGTGATRGQPLSVRLVLLMTVAFVAVLLLAGFAVNRVVSRSLADELAGVQRDRLAFLAAQLEDVDLDQPRVRQAVRMALQRAARPMQGRLEVVDADGSVLLAAGELRNPDGAQVVEEPVPGDAGYRLVLRLPGGDPAFLRIFNVTLVVAGVLAVGALIVLAALLSDRLTRPLRGVAAAARRLGAGDLAARAAGGPDRESTELAEAFNAMAARLEQSEVLRRRAASDMAHDLATPATVLESQLQAMVDGVLPADAEQLERARAAAAAMSGVVTQLRDLVDVEAAPLQRRAARVAVGQLMDEAAAALQPLFAERDVRLSVDAGDVAAAVEVDPLQVGRALRNVLTNAAQHSPRGASVTFSAAAEPGAVALRVADAGPGIAPEDVAHVFERFYRADRARSAAADEARTGSGIGLTIARELLAANGGSIDVERTGPDGTTFLIRLPAPKR